eukprot:TRINITY_DN27140_c0_g1_i1.p3 TRINITY_DN27140_c0_g1~~TRINITY_DN27140_c0_g1_i1.p3  ORF type:complete len:231 (+),score=64.59 TRINITY_DN27140_c0_g1_i1:71-694(+)
MVAAPAASASAQGGSGARSDGTPRRAAAISPVAAGRVAGSRLLRLSRWSAHADPASGELVYFDQASGTASWTPPAGPASLPPWAAQSSPRRGADTAAAPPVAGRQPPAPPSPGRRNSTETLAQGAAPGGAPDAELEAKRLLLLLQRLGPRVSAEQRVGVALALRGLIASLADGPGSADRGSSPQQLGFESPAAHRGELRTLSALSAG